MSSSSTDRPYADAVVAYAQAGWPCILPVPAREKTPPPIGFTGADGRDTDPLTLVQLATDFPHHAVALRMPENVIGIDVDQYEKAGKQKHGAVTLAEHLERWGPLPPTWSSTARGTDQGPGESRIMLFRVPPQRYATKLTGASTSDVEIIQRHHRYAVVWPSPHGGVEGNPGAVYRWYDPQGRPVDAPPKPSELPELPAAWVEGLAAGASEAGPAAADVGSGRTLLDQLLEDYRPECADITSARQVAVAELSSGGKGADAGSRHDTMTARVHHLVQLAAAGHTGVANAVLELRDLWETLTAGEDRADELERMLLTSARKAVTVVGAHQVPRDPCLLFAGGTPLPPGLNPAGGSTEPDSEGDPEVELQIVEPPRWASVREVIGTHAFDPNAGLDQALAERVLERTYPALRYAYDSGGWLLRVPEAWELHGKLSPWAVAQVAALMPVGDPTAEKGSDQHERSKRRARLMSNAGARAVAGVMDALVAGGMHPASVALSRLDADPEVLWAGGHPWDLAGCTPQQLAVAQVDPATPHMRTAALMPEHRPTPLWDAFLAAVWPDPAIRAWALRVLSIAVTGYADRALPILLGETGRGKTQVVALMMSVLGSYAHAANPKLLSATSNEHDTIVFDLKGRRFSFIDEAPSDAKAGQERLKQLTGGGELTARRMNQDPITFRPTHTLVLTANDEPVLTDPAIRSRVRLIPCDGDPDLVREARAAIGHVSSSAWRAEAPGVLAQLMGQAGAWLADSSTALTASAPESIRYLAEHFGAEQDPVGLWVAEETEPSETGTPSRELYQAFVASCRRNSMRADSIPSETKWGRQLTRLGYPAFHSEHGKRRPLVLRSGGFLPGMTPPPASGATTSIEPPTAGTPVPTVETPAILTGSDGLLTGSEANPSGTNAQVTPNVSVGPDGSDGLSTAYTHARAHAQEEPPSGEPNPSAESSDAGVDLREQQIQNPSAEPVSRPKAPRKPADPAKTEAARQKRATAAAEKRAAAVAEAAGPDVALPALVLRDGSVTPVTVDQADELLATISAPGEPAAGELTVDVEHTGYPIGHQDYALRTVQLGDERLALVLDPHEGEQAGVIRRHLAAAAVLHAHSATADLVPLDVGIDGRSLLENGPEDAWARMVDTGVLAKLADPTSTGNDADLKGLAKSVLGKAAASPQADADRAALFKAGRWLTEVEVTTSVERSGWAQVDPRCTTMVRYAAADVLDDAALAVRLEPPPAAVLAREQLAQRMTARITHRGIPLDGDRVAQLLETHRTARAEHADTVRRLADVDNPGSNPQLAAALERIGMALPRTDAGNPSVAKGVLEPLQRTEGHVGDLVRAVLAYRHHNTALTLLLEPWHELVTRGDGRARPTIHTLGAKTGRMSCVRPNVQQVSREGGMRACFTADPGHLLISVDFAGVELRVGAALSGDAGLAAIMSDPERDLHWEVARLAFGPNATKADRYAIKRGVFGRIYGGGVGAVAAGVGVPHPVAKQVIDAMDTLTPGLSAWSSSIRDGIESGRTRFPSYNGRTIHLPKAAAHAGPNYCIQGTARELLIDALERWARTPWGSATLFPVHDEIVAMVPEDQAEAATAALVECMTSELYGVPIIAEASEPSFEWKDSA